MPPGILLLFVSWAALRTADALHDAPPRQVGWWWSSPRGDDPAVVDPAVDYLISFATKHRNIVTTMIMHCGVNTCVTNYSLPRGSPCENPGWDGGHGGKINGTLSAACAKAIPQLTKLGVRSELWLGEDDSRESALALFAHPSETAQALIAVANANPGISGFNIDLETSGNQPDDSPKYASFLGTVTKALNGAPGGPLRFSTDVSCTIAGEWSGIASDCVLLANSGINRIMNMRTYNGGWYEQWRESALGPALDPRIPREKLAVGLGCYDVSAGWHSTAESAMERVCALMNQSVVEIAMFALDAGRPASPGRPAIPAQPAHYWIPALEKYMAGGSCATTLPDSAKCPAATVGLPTAWRPSEVKGCCESQCALQSSFILATAIF